MSRTRRGKRWYKGLGFEYWSRRPYFGENKDGKQMTHRHERHVEAKREIREQTNE